MAESENSEEILNHIARSVDALPELKEDYVRAVHITREEAAQDIALEGLDYEKYGLAMSMARAWSKPEEVEFWSDDPRFSFEGAKAVVMDIPNKEWRLHNNVTKSPGRIPSNHVVGIVAAIRPSK